MNIAAKPQHVHIALAAGGKLSIKPLKLTPHPTSVVANLTAGQHADAT